MKELKKLFQVKRILTLILAAAMIVTSLPATAFAAPASDNVSLEEEASQPDTDDPQPDDMEPADDMEAPDEESAAVTPVITQTDTAEEIQEEVTPVTPELAGDQDNPAAREGVARYAFQVDPGLGVTKKYNQGEPVFTDTLTANDIAGDILAGISLVNADNKDDRHGLDDSDDEMVQTVTWSWKKQGTDGSYADLKNQEGAAVAPTQVGRYQLTVTLPAKENVYDAAETVINFEITKAVVYVAFDLKPVAPGSPVSEVKAALEDCQTATSDERTFAYITDDPETADQDESKDSEISFTTWEVYTVKDGNRSEAPLSDTDILNKTEEYVLVAKAVLTEKVADAANYEVKDCEVKTIELGELKETRVEVTLGEKWKDAKEESVLASDETVTIPKITAKVYDAKAVADLVKDTDYTAAVKEVEWVTGEDGKPEMQKKDIAGAEVEKQGEWHSAVYQSWTEGQKRYCSLTAGGKLESAPADAGFYVYRVTYAGEKGLYDKSYADIVVEIQAAELVIKPELKKTDFYKNQSVADVLAQTDYQVYDKDGKAQTSINEAIKKTDSFWGTTQWESNKTAMVQPYKPVFEVYETVTIKTTAEDGTVTEQKGEAQLLESYDKLQFTRTQGNTTYEYSYEVRFSGEKAAYRANGSVIKSVGINEIADSSNPGYQVLTDEETLKTNVVALEVKDAALVTINTDDIIKDRDFTETILNYTDSSDEANPVIREAYKIYSKIFDNTGLYTNRAGYKKASVVDETGKVIVSGANASLTYQWYRTDAYNDIVDIKEALLDEEKALDTAYWRAVSGVSPSAAGVYRLAITYDNSVDGYYAEKNTAYVYFVIEKQLIKAAPKAPEEGFTALTGISIQDFINETDKENSYVKKLVGSEWADFDPQWTAYVNYRINWEVQVETDVTAEDGTPGKEWVAINDTWNTYFEKDKNYRLAVKEDSLAVYANTNSYTDSQHTFNETTQEGEFTYLSTDTEPITVEEMGTVKLKLQTGQDTLFEAEKVYDGVSILAEGDKTGLAEYLAGIKAVEADKADAVPFALEGLTLSCYYVNEYDSEELVSNWEAVDGGTYRVYASFKGSKDYAPLTDEDGSTRIPVAQVTITKRKVKIAAPAEITVTAGMQTVYVTNNNLKGLLVEGIGLPAGEDRGVVEKDQAAFSYCTYWDESRGYHRDGYPAWDSYDYPVLSVTELNDGELSYYDIIRYGKEYTLWLDSLGSLRGLHARNYELEEGGIGKITVERGHSFIVSAEYDAIENVKYSWSISEQTHTFSVLSGIPFTSYYNQDTKETLSSNFVAVNVILPAEYDFTVPDTAIYRKSIEEAGGYIAEVNDHIMIIFDAAKGDTNFTIRWEEGYVETFNMKFNNLLLSDLSKAVAPKSISFNGASKKMVAGSIQDLDVKLTKVQKSDVICLDYKVDDTTVLSVNEYGRLVALKPGSATVTVYPVYLENGEKTAIPGAKVATLKVTVTDVAAPKITKVTAQDHSIQVQYPYVADDTNYTYGYRREIYVQKVDGRAWTANEFEEKISSMTDGQWEGVFAVAPVFLTNGTEYQNRIYDAKKHAYTNTIGYTIGGLDDSAQYNVYVRNVNLIRTLADGSEVVKSAKGNVKAISTTKEQIDGLTGVLTDKSGKQMEEALYRSDEVHDADGFEIGGSYVYERPDGFYDDYDNYFDDNGRPYDLPIRYTVDLAEGKVKLAAEGWIQDDVEETMSRAAGTDCIAPKLSYYFIETNYSGIPVYDAFDGTLVTYGDEYRATTNFCASISKKGEITLKQPGTFYVVAVDANTGIQSNKVQVTVTADVTAIKGKTTTLEVGQKCYLTDLVSYLAGKKTLSGSAYSRSITADQALISQIEEGGFFKVYSDSQGQYVRAVKEKGSRTLELTDSVLQQSVRVTIKSKALSPVKNLKLDRVIDNRFVISFDGSYYANGYRIEVTDARGTLIRSICVKAWDDEDSNWNYWYEYNGKTGKYRGEYTVYGLTQQSKYNVKVTALYNDVPSKTMSKSGSTTKLPAADDYLLDTDMNTGANGTNIAVLNNGNTPINNCNFISGNVYTLIAGVENPAAAYAGTDKLTWSSSNKKVATVKANAGTYSATLKALKAGTTIIEIKSSVLKHVIARYQITVNAVGDAYASNCYYYGDNEDLRGDGQTPEPSYTELTLGNPAAVELRSGQYKYFTFTAPEDGTYSFYRMQNGTKRTYGFTVYNNGSTGSTPVLAKGDTVIIYVYTAGSYTMNVEKLKGTDSSERTPVTAGENAVSIARGQWFVFTAENQGLYNITAYSSNIGTISFDLYKDINGEDAAISRESDINYWLEEGETVYLKAVSGSSTAQDTTLTIEKVPVTFLTADSDPVSTGDTSGMTWFGFEPADAQYEFQLTSGNRIDLYSSPDAVNRVNYGYGSLVCWLSAGKTVLLQVPSYDELKVTTQTSVAAIKDNQATMNLSGDYGYLAFTAAEEGIYQFYSENANGAEAYLIKDLSKTDSGSYEDSDFAYSGNFCVDAYLKAGEKIYLKAKDYNGNEQNDVDIKVVKKTPIAITAEGVSKEVGAGLTEWFSFCPDKECTLLFSCEGDLKKYYYESLNSKGQDEGTFYSGSVVMDYDPLDEPVYYKVRNTSRSDAATAIFKAKEFTVEPISTAKDTTVKLEGNNLYQWFSFTAEEAAEYQFSLASDAANCSAYYWYTEPKGTIYQGGNLIISSAQSRGFVSEFAAGETKYIRICNTSSSDTNVTIKAKKKAVTPMVNGSAQVEVYANSYNYNNLRQTVSFTSTQDARYTFSFTSDTQAYAYLYEDEDLSSYKVTASITASKTDGSGDTEKTYYTGSGEYYVASGDTVYWSIANRDSAKDTTVTVKAEPVSITPIPATDGTGDVSLKAGEEKWFSFTADEEARYRFTFTNTETNSCSAYFCSALDAAVESNYVSFSSSYEGTNERLVSAGQTIYWKVKGNGSADSTIAIKAEKIEITDWPADEQTVEANSEVWYQYTATSAGRYSFTVSSSALMNSNSVCFYPSLDESNPQRISLTYKNIGGQTKYVGSTDYYLSANETVYLQIKGNASANVTVTLNAEEITIENWPESTTEISMDSYTDQWFEFTAEETARYTFTLTAKQPGCSADLYASLEDNNAATNIITSSNGESGDALRYIGTKEYYVEQGSTIYFKVSNSSNANSISLKAEKIVPETMDSEEYQINIQGNNQEWLSFTAPKTGIYKFSRNDTSRTGSFYIIIREDMKADGGSSMNATGSNVSCALKAGETMYFHMYFSGNYSSNAFEGTLSYELNPAEGLEVGTEISVSTTSTDPVKYLQFTAPEEGIYNFSVNTDSYVKAWFFVENDFNKVILSNDNNLNNAADSYESGSAINKAIDMTAGQTIQVAVGAFNRSLTTTVSVKKQGKIKELTLNESSELNVAAREYQWYSFTAPADGDYIFYSNNNSEDTKAWFFKDTSIGNTASSSDLNNASQANGNYGYDDDDSSGIMNIGNQNFAKKLSMYEGQTIYMAVGYFNLSNSVTASIYVTEVATGSPAGAN